MKTPRIEEKELITKEIEARAADLRKEEAYRLGKMEGYQAGIDEAGTQTLQEIMDDLTLLHKRKEIDDNGFCTVRDLLHSKALQDKKDV